MESDPAVQAVLRDARSEADAAQPAAVEAEHLLLALLAQPAVRATLTAAAADRVERALR